MKTLKLLAKDFKKSDSYWSDYIGEEDLSNYEGHIEIEGRLGWIKFVKLSVKGHIWADAGTGIEAGEGIEAGTGIKAGWGIEAGWGIKAGTGIEAGLSVTCKFSLSVALRIFAGLCLWRTPTEDEKRIECGRLENGQVCYGTLVELGIKENSEISLTGKTVEFVIDGKTYSAIIQ